MAALLAASEAPWRRWWKRSRRALLAALTVAAAMAGGFVWLLVQSNRSDAVTRLADMSSDVRTEVWRSVVADLPTYWPWGTGIGAYADPYRINEPDSLLRPTYSNHAHNEWIEIAYTAGLPGLILLAVAVAMAGYGLVRAWRGRREDRVLARTGGTVLLVLAIASTTDYPVRTPIMSAILILAALWLARDAARHGPVKS